MQKNIMLDSMGKKYLFHRQWRVEILHAPHSARHCNHHATVLFFLLPLIAQSRPLIYVWCTQPNYAQHSRARACFSDNTRHSEGSLAPGHCLQFSPSSFTPHTASDPADATTFLIHPSVRITQHCTEYQSSRSMGDATLSASFTFPLS